MPAAFAEVRDGDRAWSGAAGVADLSTGRPARPDMRHRVGSITKSFVATTVLQLSAEGRLGLDDPIGRWLPEQVSGELGQRVTIRMLLNHTSGIGNYTDAILDTLAEVISTGQTTYTPERLVQIGLSLPPTGPPGDHYSYSNTGYVLAGLLIEKVTGNDAATEVTRRVIRPLRLRDTYFPGADPWPWSTRSWPASVQVRRPRAPRPAHPCGSRFRRAASVGRLIRRRFDNTRPGTALS